MSETTEKRLFWLAVYLSAILMAFFYAWLLGLV